MARAPEVRKTVNVVTFDLDEAARDRHPDGFPALPPVPAGRGGAPWKKKRKSAGGAKRPRAPKASKG